MFGINVPEKTPPPQTQPESTWKILKTAGKALAGTVVACFAVIGLKIAVDSFSESARLYKSMSQSGLGSIEFVSDSIPCKMMVENSGEQFPEVRGALVLEMLFEGKKIRIVDRNADGTSILGDPDEVLVDGGRRISARLFEGDISTLREVYAQGVQDAKKALEAKGNGRSINLDGKRAFGPMERLAFQMMPPAEAKGELCAKLPPRKKSAMLPRQKLV